MIWFNVSFCTSGSTWRVVRDVISEFFTHPIYKSLVRPNLDYGDIICDKPNNESFKSRIKSIQCKACIAITGAIQGTSRGRLYWELGLESLRDRCWFRRLTVFYKIVKGLSPRYLTKYVNLRSTSNYQTKSANKNYLQEFSCRTEGFKHFFFFAFFVRKWNKLNNTIQDAESIKQFRSMLKHLFSLNQRLLFSMHDPVDDKLLTRLSLRFSHLNEHKFRHNFKDCMIPMCGCGAEAEATSRFFFCCQFFAKERQNLRDGVYRLNASIKHLDEESLMTVKINKYFFIQSVTFKLPNVLKDLFLPSANFRSITTVVFLSYISA